MITKTGMHAVRAMVVLARLPEGAYAGAARVAREIDAPQNYLGKLLQTLAREGLVQSQKGLGGGFCLARPARRISLYDVVEPIERLSRWSGCLIGRPVCSEEEPCAIHHRWKKVRTAYLDLLRKTTIADLVAGGEVAAFLA
jgi:Rrf2 family iron-sulfur cluster assembly transcriptional regulator